VTTTIAVARAEVAADRARVAYVAFLAFIFQIYASLPQLVPALGLLAPGKTLIGLAALALGWSCIVGRRPFRVGAVAGGKVLYIFFAIIAASPLWSLWPKLSFDTTAEGVKFFAAFVVAVNVLDTRRRVRQAAAAIALASLFPALGAIWNFTTGADLIEHTRAVWIGVFRNPNFLAYHLVVSSALVLALRDTTRKGSPMRQVWLAVLGIFAAAILLTESRGGSLGMGAVLLLWLGRGMARGKVAIGAALAVAIALLVTPMSPLNREYTQENLSGVVDISTQGRIDAWRTALRMVYDRPLLGVGAGAFVLGYAIYAPGDAGPPLTAHNSFAVLASELGLPALAVFACALVASFRALRRVARAAPPRSATMARGLQTAIFGFVVCSMVGSYAFSWPIYFCFGMAAALTLREQQA
jgi:O-antigen ligase